MFYKTFSHPGVFSLLLALCLGMGAASGCSDDVQRNLQYVNAPEPQAPVTEPQEPVAQPEPGQTPLPEVVEEPSPPETPVPPQPLEPLDVTCFPPGTLSPEGRWLITSARGALAFYEVDTGEAIWQQPDSATWEVWHAHPDGQRFVVARALGEDANYVFDRYEVSILSLPEGDLHSIAARVRWSPHTAFPPPKYTSQHWIALSTSREEDNTAHIKLVSWDTLEEYELESVYWPDDTSRGLSYAFEEEGRYLLAFNDAPTRDRLLVWDLAQIPHEPRRIACPRRRNFSTEVQFSPDGTEAFFPNIGVLVTLDLAIPSAALCEPAAVEVSPDFRTIARRDETTDTLWLLDRQSGVEQIVHEAQDSDTFFFEPGGGLFYAQHTQTFNDPDNRDALPATFYHLTPGSDDPQQLTVVPSLFLSQSTLYQHHIVSEHKLENTTQRTTVYHPASNTVQELPGTVCNYTESSSPAGGIVMSYASEGENICAMGRLYQGVWTEFPQELKAERGSQFAVSPQENRSLLETTTGLQLLDLSTGTAIVQSDSVVRGLETKQNRVAYTMDEETCVGMW